jgi:hypothetical protein
MSSIHFDLIRPDTVLVSVVQDITKVVALKLVVGGAREMKCKSPLLIDPAQKILWMSRISSIIEGSKPPCFEVKLGSKVVVEVT